MPADAAFLFSCRIVNLPVEPRTRHGARLAGELEPICHAVDNGSCSDMGVIEKISSVEEIPGAIFVDEYVRIDGKVLIGEFYAGVNKSTIGPVRDRHA